MVRNTIYFDSDFLCILYSVEKVVLRIESKEASEEWEKAMNNEHEALTKLADMCGKEEHK